MAKYDDVRCPVCGVFWLPTDGEPAHPVNDTCYRHRPGALADGAPADAPRPRVPTGPEGEGEGEALLVTPGDVELRRELIALRESRDAATATINQLQADVLRLEDEARSLAAGRDALLAQDADARSVPRLRAEVERLTSDLRVAEAHYRGVLKVCDDLHRQRKSLADELEWTRKQFSEARREVERLAGQAPATPPPATGDRPVHFVPTTHVVGEREARPPGPPPPGTPDGAEGAGRPEDRIAYLAARLGERDAQVARFRDRWWRREAELDGAEKGQLKAEVSQLNASVRSLADQLLACRETLRGEVARREDAEAECGKYHEWAESKRPQIDHLRAVETREQMMRYELEALRRRALEDAAEIERLGTDNERLSIQAQAQATGHEVREPRLAAAREIIESLREWRDVFIAMAAKLRAQREQVARACVYRSSLPGTGQPEQWRIGSPTRTGETFATVDEAVARVYRAAMVDVGQGTETEAPSHA